MAFLAAVPSALYSTDFLKSALYRGKHQLSFDYHEYVFCIGNNSEDLLSKSFTIFGNNSFLAFDTSPWVFEDILPAIFHSVHSCDSLDMQLLIDMIRKIKADFHCILYYEGQLFAFHSLVSNRPLFFANTNKGLIISNSLKSAQQLISARISIRDLAEFLIPEYSNPNNTVWDNIRRIKPGSLLTNDGTIVDFQKFEILQDIETLSVSELINTMKTKFENAVSRSLYGTNTVLLSGGIDSSSIICTALQQTRRITGYSLVYNDQLKKCDEQQYVDAIIEMYDLDVRRLPADTFVPFSTIIDDTSEPELWPYTVRNYALLNYIRQEFPDGRDYINVIAGEGGDELLLGQIFSVFERFMNESWQSGMKELLLYENDPGDDFKRTVESEAKILMLLANGYYATEECLRDRIDFDIPDWLTEEYITKYNIRETIMSYYPIFYPSKGITSRYSQYLFSKMGAAGQVECGGWHEDEILKYGLNASYPFVDYELAEFVWSLPAQYLRFEAREKWILREALKSYIPRIINCRTDKTEATPMLDDGIRRNVNLLLSINNSSLVHKLGIVDCKKYRESVYAYLLGRKDLRVPLWATYTVEKWLERNVEFL